ncbi:MAG TPA: HEAT repeat domain-containing protein [Chloroflexota bacterium]|nr:HEAT repeat domain-containing protein [Chloroflexota bacterium]
MTLKDRDALIATLQRKRAGPAVRAQAAHLLAEMGDPTAIAPLLEQVEDTTDPFQIPVVAAVLESIPRFGDAAVPHLEAILRDRADPRRHYVPRLLATIRGGAAAATLRALLDDENLDVAINAATALGLLRDPACGPALRALLDDATRPASLRGVAASALGMSGALGAYDALAPLAGSGDPDLVAGAIDGLAELGDARAVPLLKALLAAGRLDERTARGVRLALISLQNRR